MLREIQAVDPVGAAGGGAGGLPHRYSFGSCSGSRHMLHHTAWTACIDLPATTPILAAIFGSTDYVVGGAGGDCALAGAIEYQNLHSDNLWVELPPQPLVAGDGQQREQQQQQQQRQQQQPDMRSVPVPVVTINFAVQDLSPINGPVTHTPFDC